MAINYWCPNRNKCSQCDLCDVRGNFQLSDRDENIPCSQDENQKIKILGESCNSFGTKMSSTQIKQDRQKRSDDHFKKDILPTLGRDEKRHFAKKYSKK